MFAVAGRSADAGNPFGMTELSRDDPVSTAGLRREPSNAGLYWPPSVENSDHKHNLALSGGAVDG